MAVVEAADVAGELDDGGLHAEADAEEWYSRLARLADRLDHPLDAADAEAAGHQKSVEAAEGLRGALRPGERLAGYPGDVDADIVRDAPVNQRLEHALVAIDVVRVLADNGDSDALVWRDDPLHQLAPR